VSGTARAVQVASPFDGAILHRFALADAGIATSGIGRRSWLAPDGAARHHLLDPATRRPAFTGVVQATALAPTALEAEIRSKAALLSGPERAATWLPHGGVVVLDDGSPEVLEPRR
jgi:FAD:protein FMN transferase